MKLKPNSLDAANKRVYRSFLDLEALPLSNVRGLVFQFRSHEADVKCKEI